MGRSKVAMHHVQFIKLILILWIVSNLYDIMYS